MFAIRARRKAITEKDLIAAIDKVIKGYKKFSATGKYMVYNWIIIIFDICTIICILICINFDMRIFNWV